MNAKKVIASTGAAIAMMSAIGFAYSQSNTNVQGSTNDSTGTTQAQNPNVPPAGLTNDPSRTQNRPGDPMRSPSTTQLQSPASPPAAMPSDSSRSGATTGRSNDASGSAATSGRSSDASGNSASSGRNMQGERVARADRN
jgi:hypothetical protein